MPDWAKVHTELRRPGVTLMLLWLEHKEDFPDGYSYTQFTVHYKAWKRGIDVVMRQGHKAGEKLFVDFPGHKIPIYDARTGQVAHQAELFVAAMGASNFMYAEALVSQELMYWVTAHVHAFEALGGCPAVVVCDNLRSGVTQPAPLRARRQRHLFRDGGALRRGHNPGSELQTSGQGQGRGGRAWWPSAG